MTHEEFNAAKPAIQVALEQAIHAVLVQMGPKKVKGIEYFSSKASQ